MGINFLVSRSRFDKPQAYYPSPNVTVNLVTPRRKKKAKLPNPDPSNYRINSWDRRNGFLLVEVVYPDCTNFEGTKLLLFKDVTINQLKAQKMIDPHFSNNKRYYSPVARFEPTKLGRELARKVMK